MVKLNGLLTLACVFHDLRCPWCSWVSVWVSKISSTVAQISCTSQGVRSVQSILEIENYLKLSSETLIPLKLFLENVSAGIVSPGLVLQFFQVSFRFTAWCIARVLIHLQCFKFFAFIRFIGNIW